MSLEAVDAAAEFAELAAVLLGGSAFGDSAHGEHGLAFLGYAGAFETALVGFLVVGLGDGGGASDLGGEEDFDGEGSGFVGDLQGVSGLDVAGGLGAVGVDLDAADVAGVGGEGAGFEEAGGPEPLVDANGFHVVIFADCGRGGPVGDPRVALERIWYRYRYEGEQATTKTKYGGSSLRSE
jgi:hypothetical protein